MHDNTVAKVGFDGSLTTQEWKCYHIGQIHLYDSPAVNKRDGEQQQHIIPIDPKIQPDILWFILNFQSSEIEDEPDLHSNLKVDPNIPVIVVINKVDRLRNTPDLSERNIVESSQKHFADSSFSKQKRLLEIIDLVNNKWSKLMNLKAVTVTSLYDEEDGKNSKPIGVNALLDITHEHLKDDNARHSFDMLKQVNVKHTTDHDQQEQSE